MHKFLSTLTCLLLLTTFTQAQQQYTFSKTSSLWSTSDFPNATDENDVATDVALIDSLVATTVNFTGNHLRIEGVGASSSFTDNAAVLVFDTLGNFIFEKSNYFTGDGLITADQVLFDSNGNYYVAGSFASSTMSLGLEELTQSGTKAGYLIKFDVNGDYLWGEVFESDASTQVSTISLDQTGNVIVGGQFSGSGLVIGSETLNSEGNLDGFVAKIDTDGNPVWSYHFGGNQVDEINDVYVTPEDSVLVAASFNSTSVTIDGNVEATTGGFEAVAMVFDADGILHNYEVFNSTLNVNSSQIVGGGNTWYLAMKHRGLLYGNNPANNHDDIQIAKYVNNTFERNQLIRSFDDEEVTDLRILDNGNLIISGVTEGSGLQIGLLSYPGTADQQDIFLFEISETGQFVRGLRKGDGFANETFSAFDIRNDKEFWTVGSFNASTFTLDADTVFNTDQSTATSEAWLSRMSLNNLPQGVLFSNSSIPEDRTIGSFITVLDISDPDLNDSHEITLDPAKGDNAAFALIAGDSLISNAEFDFETKNSYDLELDVTDDRGGYKALSLTILVTNVNEPPTGLSLSNNSINEQENVGTVVGTLEVIDPDQGSGNFNLSLISGAGDADNSKFKIDGLELILNEALDFETQETASIRVSIDDNGEFSLDTILAIAISDNIVSSTLDDLTADIEAFGGNDLYSHLAIDDAGNRYVIGEIAGTTRIGDELINPKHILVAYSPTLEVLWADSVPISQTQILSDVVVNSDTVYVLASDSRIYKYGAENGEHFGSMVIPNSYDFLDITNDTITVARERGVSYSRYTLAGELIYEKSVSFNTAQIFYGLAVDGEHVYLSCQSSQNFNIDGTAINRRSGINNSFLLAFDKDDGTLAWHDVVGISGVSSASTFNRDLLLGSDGTIYTVNFYNGGSLGETVSLITNAGTITTNQRGFVVRYQPNGTQVSFVNYPNEINDAAIDPFGNLYLEDIGNNSISKYDASGALLWSGSQRLTYRDLAYYNGVVTGVGNFSGEITWNGQTYDATSNSEAFILNNSEFGDQQESDVIGNPTGDYSLFAISERYQNKVRALGRVTGSVIFEGDTLVSDANADPVIVEYDIENGLKVNWLQFVNIDGSWSSAADITVDQFGNTYAWNNGLLKLDPSGELLWELDFGERFFLDVAISSNGNIFISRYDNSNFTINKVEKRDSDGNLIWFKELEITGTSPLVRADRLLVDGDSVYVAGDYRGTLQLNAQSITSTSLDQNIFLAKLDHMGNTIFLEDYTPDPVSSFDFSDNMLRLGDQIILHARKGIGTINEELLITDLNGQLDSIFEVSFNRSDLFTDGNKLYIAEDNDGDNSDDAVVVYDDQFSFLNEFSVADRFYGSVTAFNDTIINLKYDRLNLSVIRDGLDGFSLATDTLSENRTGFVSKFALENPMDNGVFSTNNFRFSIANDSLFIANPANFESPDSLMSVEVTFSDGASSLTRTLAVNVLDVNEAPNNIDFSPITLKESDTVGTAVGYISATDPDADDTEFTFAPADSLSAVRFYVDGDSLRLASQLDFEMFSGSTNLTWSVYLKLAVFDSGGLSREESFSFTLENVNEFPTAIDMTPL